MTKTRLLTSEPDLSQPEFDGEQKMKLVYKDILGMLKKTLGDPKFKANLHYNAVVERYIDDCIFDVQL